MEPRYCIYKPYTKSLAPLVIALAKEGGFDFAQWQIKVLEILAAVDTGLQFIQRIFGLSVPRQNGKTTIVEWYIITLAMMFGYRILWTAHNYNTTVKTLEDFRNILGTKPNDEVRGIKYFNDALLRVSSKTAQESFTFKPQAEGKGEGFIAFSCRTKTANLFWRSDILTGN